MSAGMTSFQPSNPKPKDICKAINGRQYQCQVKNDKLVFTDVTKGSIGYEPVISSYLKPASQTMEWWKAQCAFRGLSSEGRSRAKLQKRIVDHENDSLGSKLHETVAELEQDFITQVWVSLNDDEKARLFPKRFLEETLGPEGTRRDEVLEVTVGDWANSITAAAKPLGLACEAYKMPGFNTGQRFVTIGHEPLQVRSKLAERQRECERAHQRATRELEDRRRAEMEKIVKTAESKGRGPVGAWDVTGTWRIFCPYISEQWEESSETMQLTIGYTEPGSDGLGQMYADFDFGILTGIMRFVCPTPGSRSEFHFRQSLLPSSTCKEFKFRWRGEETGEGEIQLKSDEETYPLTFQSPHVLTGTIGGCFLGKSSFTGYKTSSRGVWQDPEDLWAERSDDVYEHARVARWG